MSGPSGTEVRHTSEDMDGQHRSNRRNPCKKLAKESGVDNVDSTSVIQQWIREHTDYNVNVLCVYQNHVRRYSSVVFNDENKNEQTDEDFETYEDALENGLRKCLKQIVAKKNETDI